MKTFIGLCCLALICLGSCTGFPVDDSRESLRQFLVEKNFASSIVDAFSNYDLSDVALLSDTDIIRIFQDPTKSGEILSRNREFAEDIRAEYDLSGPLLARLNLLDKKINAFKAIPIPSLRDSSQYDSHQTDDEVGRHLQQAPSSAPTTETQFDMIGQPTSIVFGDSVNNATLNYGASCLFVVYFICF